MHRRNLIILGIVSTVVLLGIALQMSRTSRVSPMTKVRFGAVLPMTGSNANYGELMKRGIAMAVDEFNATAPPGIQLDVLIEDSRSNAKDGVSAFQKLVQIDRSLAVMPVLSPVILGCIPIAERSHTVLLNCPANSPKLRGASAYMFNLMILADQDSEYLAEYAYRKMDSRNVALFFVNNDGGRGYRDCFAARFSELGGKVVVSEGHPQGTTDFRTTIEKFRASSVDLVFMSSYYAESALFLKQCRELSYKTHWLSYSSVETPEFLKLADGAADGLVYSQPGIDIDSTNSVVARFVHAYQDRYGQLPELWSSQQYEGTRLLASAIASGARSSDQILQYMRRLREYPGITGTLSFDRDGCVGRKVRFKCVRAGHFVNFGD